MVIASEEGKNKGRTFQKAHHEKAGRHMQGRVVWWRKDMFKLGDWRGRP